MTRKGLLAVAQLRTQVKMRTSRRHQAVLGYVFAAPWILGFIIFGLYPMGMSLYYSLCRYDVLRVPEFIGFGNFYTLLFEDAYFWTAVWNTLYYTVFRTPVAILGSLLLAVLVNSAAHGVRLFRTVYFLPSIIGGVVMSVLWLWIFNPQYGLLNSFLAFFGIPGPLWLNSPEWSKPSLILMSLWSILEVIFSFQVFTEAYIMTKGGPLNSTMFYNLYLYYKAFDDFDMGYASALAWLLLLISLAITLLQFRFSKHWVYYESEPNR